MVVQCCVCKRVHLEHGWEAVDDIYAISAAPSHGYCPTCLEDALSQFDALQQVASAAVAPAAA